MCYTPRRTHTFTQLDTQRQMDASGHTPGHTWTHLDTFGHVLLHVCTSSPHWHPSIPDYDLIPDIFYLLRGLSVASPEVILNPSVVSCLFVCFSLHSLGLSVYRRVSGVLPSLFFWPKRSPIHPAPTIPASLPVLPSLPLLLTRPN